MKRKHVLTLAALVAAAILPGHAYAAAAGGGWPWDGIIQNLITEVTGTLAFALAVFAFVGAGGALILGRGEIGGFIATLLYIVLVAALIVNAVNIVQMIGGAGAVI